MIQKFVSFFLFITEFYSEISKFIMAYFEASLFKVRLCLFFSLRGIFFHPFRDCLRSICILFCPCIQLAHILQIFKPRHYLPFTFGADFAVSIRRARAFFTSFIAGFTIEVLVDEMVSSAMMAESSSVAFFVFKRARESLSKLSLNIKNFFLFSSLLKVSCIAFTNTKTLLIPSSDTFSLVAANFAPFIFRAGSLAFASHFSLIRAAVFHFFHAEFFSQTINMR